MAINPIADVDALSRSCTSSATREALRSKQKEQNKTGNADARTWATTLLVPARGRGSGCRSPTTPRHPRRCTTSPPFPLPCPAFPGACAARRDTRRPPPRVSGPPPAAAARRGRPQRENPATVACGTWRTTCFAPPRRCPPPPPPLPAVGKPAAGCGSTVSCPRAATASPRPTGGQPRRAPKGPPPPPLLGRGAATAWSRRGGWRVARGLLVPSQPRAGASGRDGTAALHRPALPPTRQPSS